MRTAISNNWRRSSRVAAIGFLASALIAVCVRAQEASKTPSTAQPATPAAAAPAAQVERPADAPPLVPIRKERDGNSGFAPPYVADPAFTEKEGVPKGTLVRFTMSSDDSKSSPPTAGRNGQTTAFERP